MNLQENGVRFAFGIEGFLDKELKDDPRYVKWIVRTFTKVGIDKKTERILPYHRCTEEDFDRFHEPAPSSARRIK